MANCEDEPAINVGNGNIIDVNAANTTTDLFKIKKKIKGETGNDGPKNVEIMVPLKYLRKL